MDFYFEDGNTSIRGHSLESPLPSRSVLDNGHEILRDLSPSLEGHTGDFQSNLSLLEDSERPNMEQPSTAFNDDVLPSLPLPLLGQEITSSQALPSLSSDYGDPIGYEDLLELSPTFRRLHANNTPVVLDLTDTPSTQGPKQSGKRSAGSSTCERSAKLARTGSSLDTHSASINFCEEQIDVVDLRESDTVAQWEENKKKEAADAIQAQNQEATRPIKLSSFQCIICMDSPTDLAITHCGHLFCSECLHQALFSGEKSCCPVCRSTINLPKPHGRPVKNSIFLLEMKLQTASTKGKETLGRT